MRKIALILAGLALVEMSCGKSSSTSTSVTLTISPVTATAPASGQVQFTAVESDSATPSLTWEVNKTTGGSATVGTISTGGLYTAPAAVPNPATITITVDSKTDSSLSVSASVTLTVPVGVTIAPTTATVLAGEPQQFDSTVAGSDNGAVTWQVNGTVGGNTTVGTITTKGLYMAPADPPSGQVVTVTAISQADTALAASATITVAPSVATLNGSYAFLFSGANSDGNLVEAGTVTADGAGKLTGGVEDVNSASGVYTNVSVTGSYTVGADGRGTLVVIPSSSSHLTQQSFDLVLGSNQQARLMRSDASTTGHGSLDLQDTTAFSAAALGGPYIMNVDGFGATATPESAIALMTFNNSNTVSKGLLDLNEGGSVTQGVAMTGSYTVSSNGRGSLTLNGLSTPVDFAFYIISATEVRVVTTSTAPVWVGTLRSQIGSNFTPSSLSGSAVFEAGGVISSTNVDDAGVFTFNTGNIQTGTGDENSGGTITSGYSFSGTYTVTSNGHGTLQTVSSAIGTTNYLMYLTSATEAVLLRSDTFAVTSGLVEVQNPSLFPNPSVTESYGFSLNGYSLASPVGALDKIGEWSPSGNCATGTACPNDISANPEVCAVGTTCGSGLAGNLDVNADGAITANLALTASTSVSANGRGSLTLTTTSGNNTSTRALNLYLYSPGRMFLIGMDSDQVVLGGADQQFP